MICGLSVNVGVCVLEYTDEYMQMDASGVPRTQDSRVSLKNNGSCYVIICTYVDNEQSS